MGVSDKFVISTTATATAVRRLKREEYKRTKHDSAFSPWKILIGPSDWEDYSLGKEGGAEKYRTHNIPNCSSCPGVYELGIAASLPQSGRRDRGLSSKRIIPVYIGEAANVRSRLQQYGREGAHLENGWPIYEPNDPNAQGLFKDVFSKGFAIVFRWAPMKNKSDAEKTEARLLETFDYAWNKGKNGARRPDEIQLKLDRHASSPTQPLPFVNKLHIFRQKKVGVRIRNCEPLLLDDRSSFYKKQVGGDILSRILKFGRSRPVVVSKEFGVKGDHTSICGVALGQGSVCTRTPVARRKRCADHKGMKINGSTPKLIAKQCDPVGFSPKCGVPLADGSLCTRDPITEGKRCEEHKGMRTSQSASCLVIVRDEHYTTAPVLKTTISSECGAQQNIGTVCGTELKKGSFYTRLPVVGRKRAVTLDGYFCTRKPGDGGKWCWQHGNDSSSRSIMYRSYSNEDYSYPSTCVGITQKGRRCSRKAAAGRETCWQH